MRYGVFSALHHRDRTGEAVHVEVPMFECISSFLLEEHFYEAAFDPPVGPYYYQRQIDPSRQPVRTKNGWITIAPYVDHRWVTLFETIGQPQELEDERINDYRGRFFNHDYLMSRVQAHFVNFTTEELLATGLEVVVSAILARCHPPSDHQCMFSISSTP